ncbi:hypothetical protein CgunFtcFv8_006197 [Champsocephalus gunnari]|nr:hypothetical protein CgunFtcFv8_006197 [Champsocephalus gunnari]
MKELMVSLCGDQIQPHIINSIKTLLTTRVLEEKGELEKFSRLILEIQEKESFYKAVSVLKTAAYKLTGNSIFPQTLSRLYYVKGGIIDYTKAEEWANTAIRRDPKNSYVADTLGQVHKIQFLRSWKPEEILPKAKVAFQAFKDVEVKADEEVSPDMVDSAGTERISVTFNNRGYFGFMQVAKIAFEKLSECTLNRSRIDSFIQEKKMEVEAKFAFFQWYLAYSQPDMQSLDPSYVWKDVVLCYENVHNKQSS